MLTLPLCQASVQIVGRLSQKSLRLGDPGRPHSPENEHGDHEISRPSHLPVRRVQAALDGHIFTTVRRSAARVMAV